MVQLRQKGALFFAVQNRRDWPISAAPLSGGVSVTGGLSAALGNKRSLSRNRVSSGLGDKVANYDA
jgi:hypothetical protein